MEKRRRIYIFPNGNTADGTKGAIECTIRFYHYFFFRFVFNIFVYAYCAFIWTASTHRIQLFSWIFVFFFCSSFVFISIRSFHVYGDGHGSRSLSLNLSPNKTLIYALTCKFMQSSPLSRSGYGGIDSTMYLYLASSGRCGVQCA